MRTLCCVAFLSLFYPALALAGLCDLTWDGDQLVANLTSRSPLTRIRLQDRSQATVGNVSLDQILVFQGAKDRISRSVGMSAAFVICSDMTPNAFAISGQNGPIVGVTVGMLNIVNADRDQAGYIIGHEIAHLILGHNQNTQERNAIIGVLGILAGVVLEKNTQRKNAPGLGYDIAQIGSALVSAKFSRDQEREADSYGVKYMADTGYNPYGAIRLATEFVSKGTGGVGLFYESHPGWEEREGRVRAMITENPAIALASTRGNSGRSYVATAKNGQDSFANVGANAQVSHAQAFFIDGVRALTNNNLPAAVDSLRSSSDLGYAPAQAGLGYLYSEGRGVGRDDVEAVRLYRLAADQGNAIAQASLAGMYIVGRGGLPKDDVEAVRLSRLAADQGEVGGQINLGAMYAQGRGGLAKDEAEAARLYRLAANQGNPHAQANLGNMYLNGLGGLVKDTVEAVRLWRLAADKGNPIAQEKLGSMYAQGLGGLPKDDAEAVKWFRLAAAQGRMYAKQQLQGRGIQ